MRNKLQNMPCGLGLKKKHTKKIFKVSKWTNLFWTWLKKKTKKNFFSLFLAFKQTKEHILRVGNSLICSSAQTAQDKWANASDLLWSLITKEQMSKSLGFFEWIAHFSLSFIPSERSEQIAQVAHQDAQREWVIVSELLRLLAKN